MEIGISDGEHRRRLVATAAAFRTPLSKMQSLARPATVDEWLHLIRLDRYAEQFRKNRFDSMERVSRIWEVELTTLVEIRLAGHLRRILVSLGNHQPPPRRPNTRPPPSGHAGNDTDDLSALTSELQKLVSFVLSQSRRCSVDDQ